MSNLYSTTGVGLRRKAPKRMPSKPCPHGRRRAQCKECGGSAFCEHGRQRTRCKECGGSGICEHGRRRTDCKECDGNAICEHGQRRSTCEECEDELPGKRDIDSIYAAALRKLARDQARAETTAPPVAAAAAAVAESAPAAAALAEAAAKRSAPGWPGLWVLPELASDADPLSPAGGTCEHGRELGQCKECEREPPES